MNTPAGPPGAPLHGDEPDLYREHRVWAKPELLKAVWGFENPTEAKTRTVDAHACRLRHKLRTAGARHLVVNRRGVGYALTTNSDGNGGEAA